MTQQSQNKISRDGSSKNAFSCFPGVPGYTREFFSRPARHRLFHMTGCHRLRASNSCCATLQQGAASNHKWRCKPNGSLLPLAAPLTHLL